MSQCCGSLAALSRRSPLTVILYCAEGCDAVSALIDTPAKTAQAMLTSLRPRCCMIAASLNAAIAFGAAPGRLGNKILSAKGRPGNVPAYRLALAIATYENGTNSVRSRSMDASCGREEQEACRGLRG